MIDGAVASATSGGGAAAPADAAPFWRGVATVVALVGLLGVAVWPLPGLWPTFGTELVASVVFTLNAFWVGSFLLCALLPAVDREGRMAAVEWMFLAVALGLGLFAWVMMPAGLVAPYDRRLYRGVHAVLLLAGGTWWLFDGRARRVRASWEALERPPWTEVAAWSLLLATGLYLAYLHFHGILGSDAQTNHLYSVLEWEAAGRFTAPVTLFSGLPYTYSTGQPLGGRLLLLHLDLLGSVYATGGFNIALLGLTCIGVFSLGSRLFGQSVGRLGALIFLTTPAIVREYAIDVSDYPVNAALFLATSVGLVLAFKGRSRAWIRVAFVLAGALCGVKYYSLMELGLLLPIVGALLWRYDRPLFRSFLVALPIVAIVASPWLVYSWVMFRNPIWPFLNSVIGGKSPTGFWWTFFATRPYAVFAGLPPETSMLAARLHYVVHDLFPARDSVFAFSPLLMPALAFWVVASFRERRYLIPIIWTVGFLAVAEFNVMLSKYMFIVIGATAPFIALPMWRTVERRPRLRAAVFAVLFSFVLLVAWQDIAGPGREVTLLTLQASAPHGEPIQTLNALPPNARVFLNFQFQSLRYYRVFVTHPFFADADELLCDDWASFFEVYRRRGVTHYLVEPGAEGFPYDWVMPYAQIHDPRLARELRIRRDVFERNRRARDEFLQQHAKLIADVSGYRLYALDASVVVGTPLGS
jgi:hypothetical protein